MSVLLGILLVLGSVGAGFELEGGTLKVLFQPAELVIILGGALGTLILGNPARNVRALWRGLSHVLHPSEYTKEFYLETLSLLNELFLISQSKGVSILEKEIDSPEESKTFQRHPRFLEKRSLVAFVCDTLRVFVAVGSDPADLNQVMEEETEVLEQERSESTNALTTIAEALPGLGIVAAVLGVILTMGVISGPTAMIGQRVATSLVGTFIGILLSYGMLGPLAARLEKKSRMEVQYRDFLRVALVAHMKKCSPRIALEFARRTIPPLVRPGFEQMEAKRRREERFV